MSEELDKLEQLFHAALELPSSEERTAYLAQACSGDAALQRRVEKLLRAHQTVGQFLSPDTPPVQSGLPLSELDLPPSEKPGDQIGRYTLVERIGEGGCCVVYRAEQAEPVRRQVALKLIKAGMDTRQVVARFEVERQALALMDHPHIARVFDAGITPMGRPYVVMELVRGIPITRYCDQHALTVKQRLELFVQVCQAVQHAHQKGIIHRDLKPSNILVTTHDSERGRHSTSPPSTTRDQPAPRIIDFGIAKAVQARLTDQAVVTSVGQFVGTPAYMSPEQAAMNSEDIDVRSDIYSLGVLLYELLTGVTPFDQETLSKAPFDEIRRTIQEMEPPKPSTRLSELSRKQKSEDRTGGTADGGQRAESQGQNWKEMRGDLDWIVMKALDKDRARRYATANDLAEDVQRYLSHEPVLAGPPGAGYRARKFIRRHRVGVAVATTITLALLSGLSLALLGLQQARQAEMLALQERDRAQHAEEQMRRERDRAIQAEADTRGILSQFDERLAASDDGIALYYDAARLARERLQPTNPAAMNFILPLGRNLGRRGAWSETLEVYLWLSETASWNCDLQTHAHAAALAAGHTKARRELRAGIVEDFGNARDSITAMQVARAVLIDPDFHEHLQIGLDCADKAFREMPDHTWCRIVQGMAEYRRGRWPEAIEVLRSVERCPDPRSAAVACSFGAMARHRAGQTTAARETLDRASRQLRRLQQTGVLPGNEWHFVVFSLVARAEAERLILAREVSPPVTVASLAEARRKWKAVREELALGDALAVEGKWDASRDAYVRALEHPAFDWDAAEAESASQCLSIQMGTVFARTGDSANHERFCRMLLRVGLGGPDNPSARQTATARAERYARACFLVAQGLTEANRQTALELARFAVTNQEKQKDHHAGWTCLAGGMAELHAGDPARALTLLEAAQDDEDTALRSMALVYRALTLKKLNRSAEAVQSLQDGEKLFSVAQSPGVNLHWWDVEQCRLALQETRQSVHPETNDQTSALNRWRQRFSTFPLTNVANTEVMVSPLMALPPIPRDATAIAAGGRHCLALRGDGSVLGWGDHAFGQSHIPACATNVLAIAAGLDHSLALRSNGTLVAWGNNVYGQTNIPARATNVVAISAGHYHNLALCSNGTVIAWGVEEGKGSFPDFGQARLPANATNIVAAVAGGYHSLALRANGTLIAWGLNEDGQCDIPVAATNIVAIAAGHGHNLVLKRDGTLVVWGNNEFKYNAVGITNIPPEATNIIAIAAGGFHCLALRADGRLFAWGMNEQQQCVIPLAARDVRQLAAGFLYSLALKRDGTVVAWGMNDSCQCLVPPALSWEHAISDSPNHVLALRHDGTVQETTISNSGDDDLHRVSIPAEATNVVTIAAGKSHRLALRANGTVTAWGDNSRGQCGILEIATNVIAVSAGNYHSVALRGDGTVVAWGDDSRGQTNVPAGLANVVAIASGYDRNLALCANGAVVAWGSMSRVPTGLSNVVALSVGYDHNLALRSDGTLIAWGSDDRGQCLLPANLTNVVAIAASDGFGLALKGDGTVVWLGYGLNASGPFDSRNPTGLSNVAAITRSAVLKCNGEVVDLAPYHHSFAKSPEAVAAIAAGAHHNLALPLGGSHDGWVHGWGDNQRRQATGVVYANPVPEWIPQSWLSDNFVGLGSAEPCLLTNAVSVAAGAGHSLALRTDGTVVGWGDNSDGQASPPAGLSNVVAIAVGDSHSLALKTDGTVVGWGSDSSGQRSPPLGTTNVAAIAAGSRHSLALRADGTVAAWGDNSCGQRDVPAGLSNVVAITAGDYHNLALKADGTVAGWGAGRLGTSGEPNYGQATIPDGLSNMVAIAAGRYHSLALKSDGTAIGWGDTYCGQTLVPAGATNLIAIAAGRYHSLFLKATAIAEPAVEGGAFLIRGPVGRGAIPSRAGEEARQ